MGPLREAAESNWHPLWDDFHELSKLVWSSDPIDEWSASTLSDCEYRPDETFLSGGISQRSHANRLIAGITGQLFDRRTGLLVATP